MLRKTKNIGKWSCVSWTGDLKLSINKAVAIEAGKGGAELPKEMWEFIMHVVDAEDICQFRFVNKGFLSMLSTKSFMLEYILQMKLLNRGIFLFQEEFCFTPLFYHVNGANNRLNGRLITEQDKKIEVLATAGSLILLCNTLDKKFLWNPITCAKKLLPSYKIEYPVRSTWAQTFFGMGYVEEDDDYKVVRVALFNTSDFMSEVKVYSRNAGTWSRVSDFPNEYPMCQPGVFVHGHLHWRSSIFFCKYSITSYNLKDGTYSSFEMPKVPLMYGAQQIISLDDHTFALSCSMSKEGSPHTIWILKDYDDKNSWVKYEIYLEETMYDSFLLSLQPLCLIYPKRIEILIRVDSLGCFGIYFFETGDYREVPSEETVVGFMTAYRFIPSMHSSFPYAR